VCQIIGGKMVNIAAYKNKITPHSMAPKMLSASIHMSQMFIPGHTFAVEGLFGL
jgi:hypothetical protein